MQHNFSIQLVCNLQCNVICNTNCNQDPSSLLLPMPSTDIIYSFLINEANPSYYFESSLSSVPAHHPNCLLFACCDTKAVGAHIKVWQWQQVIRYSGWETCLIWRLQKLPKTLRGLLHLDLHDGIYYVLHDGVHFVLHGGIHFALRDDIHFVLHDDIQFVLHAVIHFVLRDIMLFCSICNHTFRLHDVIYFVLITSLYYSKHHTSWSPRSYIEFFIRSCIFHTYIFSS